MPDPPQRQSKIDEPVGEPRSGPLHALFEDVTGSAEIVADQEPSASTRDDDATTALSEYVKQPRARAVPFEGRFGPRQDEQRRGPDTEAGFGVGLAEHVEPDDVPVELGHLLEVGDVECRPTETRVLGEFRWIRSGGHVGHL